ncbi:MAG: hypothetical protein COV72_05710 [Candidatus Omnitrophica bacterium CG11_big_fil_rev_8_21_14_0_20_42_13]|uniref:Uncharacterized protein n=1 Tax=Candidatus Ghiorseimicrobium undicola TaxID=1974746 RepID=A0A2H0LWY8_9BACT|nr:MAG: hypothetical protein COV72_05710 [Candidatus Omnitrophica bacterium CG11_big_fil_rev_8_21_14_0_20_42_13]
MIRIFFVMLASSFEKIFKKPAKSRGQVSLEYFVLFCIATMGMINLVWFNWSGSGKNAVPQGRVVSIAQDYFNTKSQEILGN